MYLSRHDLSGLFNIRYFERGLDYYKKGMVISAKAEHNGEVIHAKVRGSGRKTYTSQIFIEQHDGTVQDIHGQCSCPVFHNCKHIIAALLHYIDHQPPQQSDMFAMPATGGGWLEQLKATQQRQQPQSAEQLLYVLDMHHYTTGRQVYAKTYKARQLKNGAFSSPQLFSPSPNSHAKYMRDDDPHALGVLASLKAGTAASSPPLVGASGTIALQVLIDTGRCFWASADTPGVKHAESISGRLTWQQQSDGTQSVIAENLGKEYILLPLMPLHYLNTLTGDCGVFQTGLPEKLASLLAASPNITPADAPTVRTMLQDSYPGDDIPLPETINITEHRDIQPIPCLHIEKIKDDFMAADDEDDFVALLHFEYLGEPVHPLIEPLPIQRVTDHGVELIYRNEALESQILNQLEEMGLINDDFFIEDDVCLLEPVHRVETWVFFMLNEYASLLEQGWQIDIDDNFAFHIDSPDDWIANITEDGTDWFNLNLGFESQGEQFNLLPFLVNFLADYKKPEDMQNLLQSEDDTPILLRTSAQQIINLPLGEVRHIISTLVELHDPQILEDDGSLRLSRYQSRQLIELDDLSTHLTWKGGKTLRQFGERLKNFSGVKPVKPPTTLKAELRDYQQAGLNWLQFLREYELGGILADDMGLGKTIQTLAHILIEKRAGRMDKPCLVVAPTSLMVNWRREAMQFAPTLNILTLQGPERKKRFPQISKSDLVLTTYPLLSRDHETLLKHQWHLVILDEAQHIKNPRAKAAQTARQLNTRHRLCLTGTPMENHLGELWSQFHFLMPGMLSDEKRFRKIFRTPIEKHQDGNRQQQLRQRLAPFMLRREKSEVATELPPKTIIISETSLEGTQRDLYETIRLSMHQKVKKVIKEKGFKRSQIEILDALLKLRQVCCHPQLLKLPGAKKVKHSAKMEQLMEMIPEMVEEGRRILLFSQFTSMLSLIEDELKKHKITYSKLTGQTRNREKPIDDFQGGKTAVFLISLKAGGAGLNLTAADTVIHYDPWWNPAAENQATDRAYRIGQDKPVFVYKMITAGTVEEKIAEMQAKKQALADALFSESTQSGHVELEDLESLFQPIG